MEPTNYRLETLQLSTLAKIARLRFALACCWVGWLMGNRSFGEHFLARGFLAKCFRCVESQEMALSSLGRREDVRSHFPTPDLRAGVRSLACWCSPTHWKIKQPKQLPSLYIVQSVYLEMVRHHRLIIRHAYVYTNIKRLLDQQVWTSQGVITPHMPTPKTAMTWWLCNVVLCMSAIIILRGE